MSKKNKARKVTSQNPANTGNPAAIHAAGISPISRPFTQTFNPDYKPVIKDLKRIGTLAVSFFVVLIVLSFFLR